MNLISRYKIKSLSDKRDIKLVFNKGLKISTSFGPVYLFKKGNTNKKVAIFVKKKVGNAVFRNYIKRIIRSYIRENVTLLDVFDRVIFLYNKFDHKISYRELIQEYNEKISDKVKVY